VQAIGRQLQRAPDVAPFHSERHRLEQTTLYCLVQQHAASFIAHTESSTGAELLRFIKDEFDAFQECGILAHGFLWLRCGECGHDKVLALSCKRHGFCPNSASGVGNSGHVGSQTALQVLGTGIGTLRFVAIGTQDSPGGSLDSVSMTAAVPEPGT
jgi:hypothetical protein